MEPKTIETFLNTRCKIGGNNEATTSKDFGIETDFLFFDNPGKPKPFIPAEQVCYIDNGDKDESHVFTEFPKNCKFF